MNTRHLYYFMWLFIIGSVIFINNCAPRAKLPVMRPAEINLKGTNKIIIGDIDGNIGTNVADLVSSRLFETGQFDIIDRSNLNKMLNEQSLNLSGAVDSDTAIKVGKLIGASALITGSANKKCDVKKWRQEPYKDNNGNWHQSHFRSITAKVNSTLKVIDMSTGKVLAVKNISKENSDSDGADNRCPDGPDEDVLITKGMTDMVDTFMKMIAPYTEHVEIVFEKSDLPESEVGFNYAMRGMWKDALEQFTAAKDKNPTDAGAWFNMGLAYEYSYMFEEAINAFKEAYRLDPSESRYIEEISNVKRLQDERKKLEQQGCIN